MTTPAGPTTPTEDAAPIRQVNTSGGVLYIPALHCDVHLGEEVEYPELLPGFTATETLPTEDPPTEDPKATVSTKKKPDQPTEPAVATNLTKEP
jgi:hypothetical protein